MTVVTVTWADFRTRLIELFDGERPKDDTERDVLAAWRQQPARVEAEAERIAGLKRSGAVRSAWAVLRAELESKSPAADRAVADPAAERASAVRRAQRWLENAGRHFPTAFDVTDELFVRGCLKAHRSPELEAEMLTYWEALGGGQEEAA